MWKDMCRITVYFKRKLLKCKFTLAIIIVLVCSATIILNSSLSIDLYFLYRLENVSCHYTVLGDGLPQVNEDFNPPSSSIFFHETSCRGFLNSRQACAVESAARAHPDWSVYLLFTGPVKEKYINNGALGALKIFENVHVMRLHLVDYAKETPLEEMVRDGALNRTRWRISHTSDVLRYLSLYKWGGVYLDLDVMVVKSFEGLSKNFAARESDAAVAAGVLAFSADSLGRIVASAALRDLKTNYRGDVWSTNGPGVITRVLRKLCDTDELSSMNSHTCRGFEVYGPEMFYPVSWTNAQDYFKTEELKVKNPYTYHVWNKFTSDVEVKRDSVYAKLARKYCPTVYELYGDQFGT